MSVQDTTSPVTGRSAPAAPPRPAGRITGDRGQGASEGAAWTESTRLMCAGAYLDATFAQDVFDEVINERHKAVHVPYGVDIVPVAKHCLAARRRKLVRDSLLFADLIFALVALGVRSSGLLLLAIVGAWLVVFVDAWRSTFGTDVKKLGVHTFDPEAAPATHDQRVSERIEELAAAEGNTTVYSGFSPFVGDGYELPGWSFVVDLLKPKRDMGTDFQPSPVEPREMYDAIRTAIDGLVLANVTVEDGLYIQGADIRETTELLPDPLKPPRRWIQRTVAEGMVGSSGDRMRHYQCIRVLDWRGELVLSLYVRFPIRGKHMFCEYNVFLLPPLKEDFHKADGVRSTIEVKEVLSLAGRSIVAIPVLWLRSPRVALKPLTDSRRARRARKDVEHNPLFDYGASQTALDRVRSTDYRRYFQRADKEMYVKLLERTTLDTIIAVLSKHGVDTSLIDESRATIVNNGIMTGGGSVHGDNVAVGTNAGIVNRVRGAVGAARGAGQPADRPVGAAASPASRT